ncbi:MAG: heavy metal translocating P-type ATPase [Thermoplasmata archaeon]|nr:heavy metal translocating P-type ATPase [Thermoplasmata archaeon]MCI4359655.1 heavy metal translocating P-type ATPase [Thermoplasmata archaeon]
MATDPVCGMSVDERSSELILFRDGRAHYFCSESCLAQFADPLRSLRRLKQRLLLAWPLSIAVVLLVYLARFPGAPYLELVLAALVQFYVGAPFYRGTWDALRSRVANMDILIAVGSTLAFGYSALSVLVPGLVPAVSFFDASALIVTLILTGHYLEQATRRSASSALLKLPGLLPGRVSLTRAGLPMELAPSEVEVGDRFVVPPGGRVPADGKVVLGSSSVDESILTGEAMPVRKGVGDPVVAGALNQEGRLEVEAERVGDDTFLAQVGRLLAEAETSRMPLRRLADRISERFVPFVFAVGLAASLGWVLLGAGPAIALLVLVSVIITACPCAFGIATPAAILVGTGRAAERGILFRGSDAIERASRVDLVLTDKTGTITSGTPKLIEIVTAPNGSDNEMLRIAAGLEASVPHPLARALVAAARERQIEPAPVQETRVVPGLGVFGTLDGRPVSVRWAASLPGGPSLGGLDREARRFERLGRSWTAVWSGETLLGLFGFSDPLSPGVRPAVDHLRDLGVPVVLVTGDSEAVGTAIAAEAGISEVHARMSPGAKLEFLRQKQSEGHRVAFVGDGVNDAPVLAAADLGIALGSGTDVAQAAGNVLLVRTDFDGVPAALEIGRRTVAKVRQNLGWAIAYNAILLPVAAGALVPLTGLAIFYLLPITGAFAMGLSSTIVVANSLSLRRTRPWRRSALPPGTAPIVRPAPAP